MPEPPLHLHRVPAAAEEHRRARVAERVEADPRLGPATLRGSDPLAEPGVDGGRLEHAGAEPEKAAEWVGEHPDLLQLAGDAMIMVDGPDWPERFASGEPPVRDGRRRARGVSSRRTRSEGS